MPFPWKLFNTLSHWLKILFKTGKQCAIHENCTKRSFRSCAARFGQIASLGVIVLKIVTLAWNSRQNGKTVRFPLKLYKTLLLGHAEHVLAKSHFWASKFWKSWNWPQILFKTGKLCTFHKNCTKRSFQVMRSTFWPNRISEHQISHNRHTRQKLASKRENSALSMKVVQNALVRSCAARFGQIAFLGVKAVKIVTLASKFSPKREHSALFMKSVQNALFRSCAARFGQIAFLSVKLLTIVTRAWNLLQNGKTARFSWKVYKTLFSGHAQHVLAKSHLWASKFSKSSHWPQILSKKRTQCAFHVNSTKRSFQLMRSTFWLNRIFEPQSFKKLSHWPHILSKKVKQCAFHENCTKRSFQVMRSTFWQNRISERQSSQNRHTGLKFSSRRNNSALSMKIVQNALFRSCAARFSQIAGQTSKNRYIVSNSRQNGKTVRFPWILYKTLFSGHAQHVLAKSHFWAAKVSQSSHWPDILSKNGKQYAFHEYCTKHSFQVMRSTFWPNRIIERQSSQNRHTGLKFSSRRKNSALSMKIVQNALFRSCAARFGQIAFLRAKLLKIVTLSQILAKTGKQCAFHENCTKRYFQVMGSTFWPNGISERQSSHNRHTRLKFALKREDSALSMTIVQNPLFRSCAARIGEIALLSVKVLKIVTLP